MRKIFLVLALVFVSIVASAHGDKDERVVIENEGTGYYQAGQFEFIFQLFDTIDKKMLSDLDLNESHTKKLHFISYDVALKEFTHVHPTFDGKVWRVMLDLSVDGKYFVWTQGELLDSTEFSSSSFAVITGGKSENLFLPLGEVRKGVDKNTTVTLAGSKIKAGKMAMINFTISRTDGQAPKLSPYLGAFAHVIATPMDGDSLIHVHPQQGSQPTTGMLHATFPSAGDYRIWIQLVDHSELITIPLSVTVLK